MLRTSHSRLRGAVPADREGGALAALAGGKQLLLVGGIGGGSGGGGSQAGGGSSNGGASGSGGGGGGCRDAAILSVDAARWDAPGSARLAEAVHGHSATPIGRSRLLMLFGLQGSGGGASGGGGAAGAAAAGPAPSPGGAMVFTADARWAPWPSKPPGAPAPPPRSAHAAACARDRVFVFGGVAADDGRALGDLWSFDLNTSAWAQLAPAGAPPRARRGASLCADEDGRRLYLFGGHDGARLLNDVHCLDAERLAWTAVAPLNGACGGDGDGGEDGGSGGSGGGGGGGDASARSSASDAAAGGVLSAPGVPEPREGAAAGIVGRYMIIAGGCSAGAAAAAVPAGAASSSGGASGAATARTLGPAASRRQPPPQQQQQDQQQQQQHQGGPRQLVDAYILDLAGPQWALLDEGQPLLWLKPVRARPHPCPAPQPPLACTHARRAPRAATISRPPLRSPPNLSACTKHTHTTGTRKSKPNKTRAPATRPSPARACSRCARACARRCTSCA